MEWISVLDKKPTIVKTLDDEMKDPITLKNIPTLFISEKVIAYRPKDQSIYVTELNFLGSSDVDAYGYTHWMPLPPCPNAK